jgi:LCP family protein required for cell wall assembly
VTQVESFESRRASRPNRPAGIGPTGPQPSGPSSVEDYEDAERRGSHATVRGQGFSWVLGWTIVGALIPGTGLIAAGWRRLGAFFIFLLLASGVALAGAALIGNQVNRAISLAVDPKKLLLLAIGASAIAVLWAAVIVLTNTQLRRYANLTSQQGVFSWIVVVALVVGVGVPGYEVGHYSLIQRSLLTSVFKDGSSNSDVTTAGPNSKKADPWADKPRENVLLVGSDAGADRTGIRPDSMIVASIDTKTGNTVLFSLPRNLERAPFPKDSAGYKAWPNGYYCPNAPLGQECLLNAIWTWASTAPEYKKYKDPGLRATEDAIEGVLGLKIDTYAMLNLKGFAQFINAVGGLRVNVDERLPIGGNAENPVATGGYIEKGKNKLLDGYETLWFARSRWSTNDYDRMRRQRCVIGDVVSQADPVTMAKAFPKIAKAAKSNLSTGIPLEDLQAWVTLSSRVKKAKVTSLPFTDQVIPNRSNPDYAQIHDLVAQALTASNATTSTAAPTPSASASTPAKAKKKAVIDPSKAQNVKDVC